MRTPAKDAPATPAEQLLFYEARLRANPGSLDFIPLAEALLQLGRPQEAVDVCRRGLFAHPDATPARLLLARGLLAVGRLPEASSEVARVLKSAPDSVPALALQGDLMLRRADAKRALESLVRAAELSPGDEQVAALLQEARTRLAAPPAPPPAPPTHALVPDAFAAAAPPEEAAVGETTAGEATAGGAPRPGPAWPGGLGRAALADLLTGERPLLPPEPPAEAEEQFTAVRRRAMRFVWLGTAAVVLFLAALGIFVMTLRRSAVERRFQSAAAALAVATPDGYRAAAADYRDILRRDPANLRAAAQLGLAQALLAAEYGEGADAATQAQVQRAWFAETQQQRRGGAGHSAAATAARILVALQHGDREEADTLVKQAHAAHPNVAVVLYAAALVRRAEGDAEGSRSALRAALEVDKDLTAARLALAAQDLDEGAAAQALTAYGAILAAHPDHAGAQLGRALALLDSGQAREALADLTGPLARSAPPRAPAPPSDAVAVTSGLESWRQLALAQAHLALDEAAPAQAALERATAGAAPDPRFYLRLMRARLAQGHVHEARAILALAGKYVAPVNPQLVLAQAELALGQGLDGPAEQLLAGMKASPTRDLLLGRARVALGQPGAALEPLKRVEAARPRDPQVRVYVLLAQGLGEPAKADLAALKQLAGRSRLARYALGRVLVAAGNAAQARVELAAARGEQLEAGRAGVLLAQLLRDRGELGPALEVLEKTVADTGDFVPARAALGRLYELAGRNGEARQALAAVLGVEGGRGPRGYRPDPDDYVALALASARLGFVDEAEAALAKANALEAKGPRVARAQALVQGFKGEAAAAAKSLAKLPADLGLKLDLGLLERQAGHGAASEAAYQAVLKQDPAQVDALAGLGQLYLLMPGRAAQAAGMFERALAEWQRRQYLGKPKRAQLQVGLGRALLLDGPRRDLEKARATLLAALADGPADADAHYYLGRCYLAQGDAAQAAASLGRARDLDPQLADAHFYAGEALAKADAARARAAYQEYLRLAKDGGHAAAARAALDRLK
jgi:predicted Zn-dependent protease